MLTMYGISKGPPRAPAEALEVWRDLETGNRTDAEPGDGTHWFICVNEGAQEVLVVKRHPPDADALRYCGEPEVLYGENCGEQSGVFDSMPAKNIWSAPRGVVGDDDAGAALTYPLDLYGTEYFTALRRERGGEVLPALCDMLGECAETLRGLNDDKIPGLRVADTRRLVRGTEQPFQHSIGDGLTGELRTDITPQPDRVVHAHRRVHTEI